MHYFQNSPRFQNLKVLALFNFDIYDDCLEGIQNLKYLKVLKLKGNIGPNNIEKIVTFTTLEHLAVPNCGILDEDLTKILQNNKGLKRLDISGN